MVLLDLHMCSRLSLSMLYITCMSKGTALVWSRIGLPTLQGMQFCTSQHPGIPCHSNMANLFSYYSGFDIKAMGLVFRPAGVPCLHASKSTSMDSHPRCCLHKSTPGFSGIVKSSAPPNIVCKRSLLGGKRDSSPVQVASCTCPVWRPSVPCGSPVSPRCSSSVAAPTSDPGSQQASM